jgi:hypothetical protein
MRRTLPALLFLSAALLAAGCDSGGDPPSRDALFRVEATDALGDPVEGLRVGVRPCFIESCESRDAFSRADVAPAGTGAQAAMQPVNQAGTPTAVVEGRDVVLNWETASEERNEGFRLLRRAEGEDEFTQIGFADGSGTTDETQSYSYRDVDVPLGTNTYQLTQVDLDGAVTPYEDDRVTVNVPVGDEFALGGPYPNPFRVRTSLHFAVPEAQRVTARVYALDGEPAGDTPDGVYRVVFEGKTFADTARVAFLRTQDHVYQRLGTTGPDGAAATDERGYFPSLLDLPPLKRRNASNVRLGMFQPTSIVEIALTDPATGERQTYRRALRDGTNTFSLDWTP